MREENYGGLEVQISQTNYSKQKRIKDHSDNYKSKTNYTKKGYISKI